MVNIKTDEKRFSYPKNIVLSKHISPINSRISIPKVHPTEPPNTQNKFVEEQTLKNVVKAIGGKLEGNSRAFDSNYSENGTWLDSKFEKGKYREIQPQMHSKSHFVVSHIQNLITLK
jgi:hypothetical protein